MQVIEDIRAAAGHFAKPVLTIGSFDGVHLGHRRVLEEVIGDARAIGGTAAAMTFRPHPRQYFSPKDAPNILTCDEKKRELLAATGLDVLYILPFDASVANMTPEGFVEEIIVGRCHAHGLVVGHDFCFGKDAQGNCAFLQRHAPRYGFEVRQALPLVLHGERISSTLIREKILEGDMESARAFLGRPYSIVGQVRQGRGIGRTLGFPTANVEPHHNAVPPHGVYAAEVMLGRDGRRYPAAVNIGVAPTIRHEDMVIEAHLLDFAGNLTGESAEIVFHMRLRPEKKFASREELMAAIGHDVETIRAYFRAAAG